MQDYLRLRWSGILREWGLSRADFTGSARIYYTEFLGSKRQIIRLVLLAAPLTVTFFWKRFRPRHYFF